jgi:type II secretory ATPase GspE/PulE/Tfp pilus assembly ATPase PilB-like protein
MKMSRPNCFALYNLNTMFVPNRELGDFLLDARALTRAELSDLLARVTESESLYAMLKKSGTVGEDELARAAAYVLGVPFMPVPHEAIAHEALMYIPEPLAREMGMAAFKREGNALTVMLLDIENLPALAYLEREQGMKIIPQLTDRASLKRALLAYQKLLKEKYATRFKADSSDVVLDALLSHALLSRAEEIHLEPENEGLASRLNVRYRINGKLRSAMAIGAEARLLVSELKKLANLSFTLLLPQEGKFKVVLKNNERVSVRVATLPTHSGEKITLHVHHEHAAQKGFTLQSLGAHGDTLEEMHHILMKKEGLVLVSGPQGGGKSTLIYTMLDYLASADASMITVEEKIEMPLPYAAQSPVRRELGQTFASSVRAALLHSPDILMIGECNDEDTVALATNAAARGVFVIAGVEDGGASSAIQKMLSLNADPLTLAAAIRASIGTRVVKKICQDCKEEYHLARVEAAPIEAHADFGKVLAALKAEKIVGEGVQWKELLFPRAVGCSKCEGGYKGHIGLQEILPVSAITRELITTKGEREDKSEIPLNIVEDGLFKAAQGLTSIEEVRGLIS